MQTSNKHLKNNMPAPLKLWSVVRLVDYRIQGLACEADPCWEDISADTIISTDREAMYQKARSYGGLLVSTEGVPSARQVDNYKFAVGRAKAAAIAADAGVPANAPQRPAIERGDDDGLGLPDGDFDPHKAAGRSASTVG